MKFWITVAVLVVTVLLCDKYEHRLPPPIKWLYAGWLKFSHIFGMIMSTIILTIFWVIGIGIYALIFKVMHFFSKKNSVDTYWVTSEPQPVSQMQHQF